MKKLFQPALYLLFSGFIGFTACNNAGKETTTTESRGTATETAALSADELLKKGEHLVITSGCEDCHSPKKYKNGMPEPDMALRLSGHPASLKLKSYEAKTIKDGWVMTNEHFTAWVGPWGVSFASNITPDSATGIGAWTEEQFSRALREGKYHGAPDGRTLLPPMPWPNFAIYTDEELKAIFTFLKSIKPVKNAVPAPIPPKGA